MRRARARLVAILLVAGVCVPPAGAAAEPSWRLEQPLAPGSAFPVPLGPPGDLQFFAPNRGLLAVQGNAAIAQGLYVYDGQGWRSYATVCGGPAITTRVAWAGPDEFWTIAYPSLPRPQDEGVALCRFKGGQVVGSFSKPTEDDARSDGDPYRRMSAAACNGPNDCWFGGEGSRDPSGQRVGAFHLRWDGTQLRTAYAPPGRGVSDIEPHAGGTIESTYAGARAGSADPPDLTRVDDPPRLLQRIAGDAFTGDPFAPAQAAGGGTDLLGLDSDGASLWAVGGGATSGPDASVTDPVDRGPFAARLVGNAFAEVELAGFDPDDRFADVAALPGTDSAWVAVQPFAQRSSADALARVSLIGAGGEIATAVLPSNGVGRGSAARIACPAIDDCWMVTSAGWLFHWSDPARPALPVDTHPAFQGTVTVRPNEAAEQFIPDSPPEDDSQLFAPLPLELIPPTKARTRRATTRLKPVLARVKVRLVGPTRMRVSFVLRRKARIALLAKRHGRLVARTPRQLLRPGRRALYLRLDRRRWPTRVTFSIVEPSRPRAARHAAPELPEVPSP